MQNGMIAATFQFESTFSPHTRLLGHLSRYAAWFGGHRRMNLALIIVC